MDPGGRVINSGGHWWWSLAPYLDLGHTGTFDREEPWVWQGGLQKAAAPAAPAPLSLACAAAWRVGETALLELEGAVPMLGPLPGWLGGSCLWVWSVRHLVSKGVGGSYVGGIPTADQELFLVFKPSRSHFTLE